jgi:hypothetical protein
VEQVFLLLLLAGMTAVAGQLQTVRTCSKIDVQQVKKAQRQTLRTSTVGNASARTSIEYSWLA